MACSNFNLDDPATLELPTNGLIQPTLILFISEDPVEGHEDALELHLELPPGTPQGNPPPILPQGQAPPDTEASLTRTIMDADQATDRQGDLKRFQEIEAYLIRDNSGADSESAPEDSDDEEAMHEI